MGLKNLEEEEVVGGNMRQGRKERTRKIQRGKDTHKIYRNKQKAERDNKNKELSLMFLKRSVTTKKLILSSMDKRA